MQVDNSRRTVLLVDDDVLVRNLIRRNLEEGGFLVLVAATVEEALAISRSWADPIHVLLTDIEMPGRNGISLAEELMRERRDMAVLLMSGGTRLPIPEGMPTLSKPFTLALLMARLSDVVGQSTSRRPAV